MQQPSRQNICWHCTFLQMRDYVEPIRFNFMLWKRCSYGLIRFRRKRTCFILKYPIFLRLETLTTSSWKKSALVTKIGPWVSLHCRPLHLQMRKSYTCNLNVTHCRNVIHMKRIKVTYQWFAGTYNTNISFWRLGWARVELVKHFVLQFP